MGNDNIIRSSNHSVTIEKGSKNAKARSAHLEEGFELHESISKLEESEEQIFNREVSLEGADALPTSSNPLAEGGEVLSAAEKMAKLKAEVQRVNQNLDEDLLHTGGASKTPSDSSVGNVIAPNVQNTPTTERPLGPALVAPMDEGSSNNVQEVNLDGSIKDSKSTIAADISNRPRPRGAAALDALKAASAKLSKAGVNPDNKVQVDAHSDVSPHSVGLQSGLGSKDNLQNVSDKNNERLNRATTDEGKGSRNRQPTAPEGQNSENLAQISPDNRKDNRSKVEHDSTDKLSATVLEGGSKTNNTQGVKVDHLKDKHAQLSGQDAGSKNVANIDNEALNDNELSVQSESLSGSPQSVPHAGHQKTNQASLPKDLNSTNNQPVQEGLGIKDNAQTVDTDDLGSNHQALDDSALSDNEVSIDTENNNNNLAKVPTKTTEKAGDLGLPKEHIDTNEQGIPNSGIKDNVASVQTSGIEDNNQPLDEERSSPNKQALDDESALGAKHGPGEKPAPENLQEIDKDNPAENLSSVPHALSIDNSVQITSQSHEDNEAQIEQKIISAHLEPLPVEDAQALVDQQVVQSTGSDDSNEPHLGPRDGRAQPHRDEHGGGLILQTAHSDNLVDSGLVAPKISRTPQNPLKNKSPNGKVVKKVIKSAVNSVSGGTRAQEVPRASDTWAEAFRGRVAAINDQVKSLNKKLDDI